MDQVSGVIQGKEWHPPRHLLVAIKKGAFWSLSTSVGSLIYILLMLFLLFLSLQSVIPKQFTMVKTCTTRCNNMSSKKKKKKKKKKKYAKHIKEMTPIALFSIIKHELWLHSKSSHKKFPPRFVRKLHSIFLSRMITDFKDPALRTYTIQASIREEYHSQAKKKFNCIDPLLPFQFIWIKIFSY